MGLLAGFLVVVLAVGLFTGILPRSVIRYRLTERSVETTLLGVVIDRIPYADIPGPAHVRITTVAELLRTGELRRSGNLGSRGIETRIFGKVVVITRRTGDVTVITPDAPDAFVQELREKLASAALPPRSSGESCWGGMPAAESTSERQRRMRSPGGVE